MEQGKKKKSRQLTTYQYFEVLQLEYLIAELRMRIYPTTEDRAYWNRVMQGKQRTIEEIAIKNHLPSILTDEDMRRDFEKRIYPEVKGHPRFVYRNEEDRAKQETLDLIYYYNKGTEVRYEFQGDVEVGIITSYIPYYPTIKVRSLKTQEERTLPTDSVFRIL